MVKERPRVVATAAVVLVAVLAVVFLLGGAVLAGDEVPATTQIQLERFERQAKRSDAMVAREHRRSRALAGQVTTQRRATRAQSRSAKRWAARYRAAVRKARKARKGRRR